jgi:hypothetical protein
VLKCLDCSFSRFSPELIIGEVKSFFGGAGGHFVVLWRADEVFEKKVAFPARDGEKLCYIDS